MRVRDEGRMAGPRLRFLFAILAIAASGCDQHREESGQSSITVKLPPARQAPYPAFKFNEKAGAAPSKAGSGLPGY